MCVSFFVSLFAPFSSPFSYAFWSLVWFPFSFPCSHPFLLPFSFPTPVKSKRQVAHAGPNHIRRPPSACENSSDNTNNNNITGRLGGVCGGIPVPTLNTLPQAAEGARWAQKAAEGCPTLVLLFEEASHETKVFRRLTPTPKGPKAVEGCPTLAPGL